MATIAEVIRARTAARPAPDQALMAEISFFKDAFAIIPTGTITPKKLIDDIRGGVWADEVARVRRYLERGDEGGYKEAKKSLPAVSLSARLKTRDKSVDLSERIIAHSGLLQIDIDEKENPHLTTGEVVALLKADRFVALGFISPGGKGVKAAVLIDGGRHLDSFRAAEDYFSKTHSLKIDQATKDVVRICFVSHDPDAWMRNNCERLPVPEHAPELAKRGSVSPGGEATTADDIREMLKFIPSQPDYWTWLKVSSAVWSVLSFVEGTRLLMEWSPEKKPGEYAYKFKMRLKRIEIATLVWYAQQQGFDAQAAARRKRWCGTIKFASNTPEPSAKIAEPPLTDDEQDWPLKVWQAIEHQQQGDARLWAEMVGGLLKYDAYKKSWFRYNNGVWERDSLCTIRNEFVDDLTAAYDALAHTIKDDLRQNPPKEKTSKKDSDDPRLAELSAVTTRITNLRKITWSSGSLQFAQELPAFTCQPTDFDHCPLIFATENKTIDFSQERARLHSPKDMQTARAPVKYDPDATCPRFDDFLSLVMAGDADLIAYLWRAIGYSLTGLVDADVVFFCHGSGANGKTTFNSTIAMLMGGGLHSVMDIEILLSTSRQNSDVDYKKAALEGKRRVITDEVPNGRRLNESMFKRLNGGDCITARRPFELPYEFPTTHKLWIVGNHKPEIKDTDEGLWRKIHLIPWQVTIPEDQRRPRSEILAEFRQELPGILNKAIEGYLQYKDGGLQPPAKVLAATKEYRDDSDQFGQFLDQRTVRENTAEIKATDLLKAFLAWCEDNNETPTCKSSRKMIPQLRERGFSTHLNRCDQTFIDGILLKENETSSG